MCRGKKKPPVLLTPGSGWSAKQTQVLNPVAPEEVPSSFKSYTRAVLVLASNNWKIVWRPRESKLPWLDAEPDHVRRSKADEEWDGAIAKWRALVEEAGVEQSNLARKISRVHKDPIHKLALERNIDQQVKDLFDNQFAKKAPRTLMKRAGHVAMYIRWCKGKNVPPLNYPRRNLSRMEMTVDWKTRHLHRWKVCAKRWRLLDF